MIKSSYSQLNRWISAQSGISAWLRLPYLPTEINEGDVVSYSPGVGSGALSAVSVLLDSVAQGASYTTSIGDAFKTAVAQQSITIGSITLVGNSKTVVIAKRQSFLSAGYRGGNADVGVTYGGGWFTNAVFDGRGWGVFGSLNGGGVAFDTNGWPVQSCSLLVTTPYSGATIPNGQLSNGTYWVRLQSTDPTCQIALNGASWVGGYLTGTCSQGTGEKLYGGSVSTAGGVTTTICRLNVPVGSTLALSFTAGFQSLVIPRDGTNNFDTIPKFWPPMVAHYAQFHSLRLMGWLDGIGSPETTWSTRRPAYTAIQQQLTSNGRTYAWETTIEAMEAVFNYPGSMLRQLRLNVGPYTVFGYNDPLSPSTVTLANDYGRGVTALINSYNPTGPIATGALPLSWEYGNEPWNTGVSGATGIPINNQYLLYATAECRTMATPAGGGQYQMITSGSRDGTTATLQCSSLPSFLTPGTVVPALVLSLNDATWNPVSGNQTQTVLVTVGASSLSYPSTAPAATLVTGSKGTQLLLHFNPTTDLLTDGKGNSNVVSLGHKWYTRQSMLMSRSIKAVRPNDKVFMNMIQYGVGLKNGVGTAAVDWAYGDYLANKYLIDPATGVAPVPFAGLKLWLDISAVAPYAQCTTTGGAAAGAQTTRVAAIDTAFGTPASTDSTSIWGNLMNYCIPGLRSHGYQCKRYGITPECYEFNIDIQSLKTFRPPVSSPDDGLAVPGGYQVLIAKGHYPGTLATSDAGLVIAAIMDACYQQGMHAIHILSAHPRPFAPGTACWTIFEYLGQTDSPRLNSFLGYDGTKNFQNTSGPDATTGVITIDFSKAYQVNSGGTLNTLPTPDLFWQSTSSTSNFQVEAAVMIPRTRRYRVDIFGTTNTVMSVPLYLDSKLIGAPLVPKNGAGSGNVVAAPCTPSIFLEIESGLHTIGFNIPALTSGSAGFSTMTLTPY